MENNRIIRPTILTKKGTMKNLNTFFVTNDNNGNVFISLVCDEYESKVYRYNPEKDLYESSDEDFIFFQVTETNKSHLSKRLDEAYNELRKIFEAEKGKTENNFSEIEMTKASLGL